MAKRCPSKSTAAKQTIECPQEPAIAELQSAVMNIKTVLGYNGDKNVPSEMTVRGRLEKAVTMLEEQRERAIADKAVNQYKEKLPGRIGTYLKAIAAAIGILAAVTGGIQIGKLTVSQNQIEQAAAFANALAAQLSHAEATNQNSFSK